MVFFFKQKTAYDISISDWSSGVCSSDRCGDGTLSTILLSRTPDIRWTGLDVDREDAGLAGVGGLYERVHIASAAAIPEPDGAFDVVFSNSALEHARTSVV